MKAKKTFELNGVTFQAVEREEFYMNGKEPLTMTRIISPNGKVLPISKSHKESLKSFIEKAKDGINLIAKRMTHEQFLSECNS